MSNNHENQSRRERDPSHISEALSQWGQKIERICLDCGEDFEAINLGSAARNLCDVCGKKRTELEETDRLAKEAALAEDKYHGLIFQAKIPPKWQQTTFASSDPKVNPQAFRVAKRYAETFSAKSNSLVFYSPGNGTGKTHLAVCIANHVLNIKRAPVLFKKARDLMLDIRRTFSDGGDLTEADILDRVLSVQLLVLDDVGVDPTSQWLQATYWTVFDRRLDWQLPVVVTTNKPLEAPAGEVCLNDRIGDGALSRLVELCQGNVIDMSGPDLR